MDSHKLIQELCAASKHWHLPLIAGWWGSIGLHYEKGPREKISELGDAPGDNILPKEILLCLSSRRGT